MSLSLRIKRQSKRKTPRCPVGHRYCRDRHCRRAERHRVKIELHQLAR